MGNGLALLPNQWNWTLNAGYLAPLGLSMIIIAIMAWINLAPKTNDTTQLLKICAGIGIPGLLLLIIGWAL